jgi:hypothetical protein
MFAATSFSILNYDTDFFQLVRDGKIRVHISEITGLSRGKVHLSDGIQLDADVLLASTGWKQTPPLQFLPEGINKDLGLPHALDTTTPSQQALVAQADTQILSLFPRLKNQPTTTKPYKPLTEQPKGPKPTPHQSNSNSNSNQTPFTLHRFITPPTPHFHRRTRDTAFVGMLSNFSNTITAHVQGLWVGAYLARRLVSDLELDSALGRNQDRGVDGEAGGEGDVDQVQREAVLHNRFGRWRYPVDWGSGGRGPSFIFDAVPYLDLLMGDLGLEKRRKGGMVEEWFSPYGAEDYRGVNEEWAAAVRAG